MIALGDIAVMGGGCYGAFYVNQLDAARAKGAVSWRQLLVVDRDPLCQAGAGLSSRATLVTDDWNGFLDRWLDPVQRDRDDLLDAIVPTPFMPHLLALWLERRAQARWPDREVRLVPVDAPLGTPYDRLHADGIRYVSFADWICPMHCVEPLLCPVIRGPRTWEMGDAVTAWTIERSRERTTAGPALFTCRHVAYGVGMYPVRAAFDGLAALGAAADDAAGADLVIGSISACHGAIALLRVGPVRAAVSA